MVGEQWACECGFRNFFLRRYCRKCGVPLKKLDKFECPLDEIVRKDTTQDCQPKKTTLPSSRK
ncbi:MAG: hypothetical protein US74_C0016G0015 [Parcubacteria group bacterium GW2011_GWA2_38_13]|nr:MAG: hypothetical protein US74_C0016G0015 [Parcubacteria group bacterium GW2011_GWA2_38_13]